MLVLLDTHEHGYDNSQKRLKFGFYFIDVVRYTLNT